MVGVGVRAVSAGPGARGWAASWARQESGRAQAVSGPGGGSADPRW